MRERRRELETEDDRACDVLRSNSLASSIITTLYSLLTGIFVHEPRDPYNRVYVIKLMFIVLSYPTYLSLSILPCLLLPLSTSIYIDEC